MCNLCSVCGRTILINPWRLDALSAARPLRVGFTLEGARTGTEPLTARSLQLSVAQVANGLTKSSSLAHIEQNEQNDATVFVTCRSTSWCSFVTWCRDMSWHVVTCRDMSWHVVTCRDIVMSNLVTNIEEIIVRFVSSTYSSPVSGSLECLSRKVEFLARDIWIIVHVHRFNLQVFRYLQKSTDHADLQVAPEPTSPTHKSDSTPLLGLLPFKSLHRSLHSNHGTKHGNFKHEELV